MGKSAMNSPCISSGCQEDTPEGCALSTDKLPWCGLWATPGWRGELRLPAPPSLCIPTHHRQPPSELLNRSIRVLLSLATARLTTIGCPRKLSDHYRPGFPRPSLLTIAALVAAATCGSKRARLAAASRRHCGTTPHPTTSTTARRRTHTHSLIHPQVHRR
jgi:hypothetical protein